MCSNCGCDWIDEMEDVTPEESDALNVVSVEEGN